MTALTGARRYLTGVQNGWHAISPAGISTACATHSWAVCGAIVRLAKDKLQPYDPTVVPGSYDPCQACLWTVAAETGTLDGALAGLAQLEHLLAHATAAAILREARELEHDRDDAADLQLLITVARHAPVLLVDEGCAEGDCDHNEALGCPGRLACPACSLQAGPWAGEWEGQGRVECTIPGPCAVLLAIAAHFGVAEAAGGESP